MSLHPLLPEILGHRDFTKLARITNADLSSGTRAAVIPNMEALHAQLPGQPNKAVRSAKRVRAASLSAGALALVFATFAVAVESTALMTVAGVLMAMIIIGVPASLLRIWYLSRQTRDSQQQLPPGLPVIVNDTRDPSELALLHQLCAFHDYTHQCGYPIPADRWHAIVREAQIAMESGNLAAAQRVSAQINDWVVAAKAANEARRNF